MDDGQNESRWKTFTEEVEVAGNQLVDSVKGLIAEGNVRRLRIKGAGGGVILEVPLTVGAIAGGAVTIAAPWLTLIAAFAGLVARAKIEVVRDAPAAKDEASGGQPPAGA
jgi:hypothetical protein